MHIPLGNLYSWMQQICPDIMLYYFWPHGSKKLAHLEHKNKAHWTYQHVDWLQKRHTILAVANDQEPLNHSLYDLDSSQLAELLALPHAAPDIDVKEYYEYASPEFLRYMTRFNIACAIKSQHHSVCDRYIVVHSEQHSVEVDWYVANHAYCVYYWCHGFIARDWYRYSAVDPLLKFHESFAYDFNVYSRAWTGTREYRLKLLESIVAHKLDGHCRITFCDQDQNADVKSYQVSDSQWKPLDTKIYSRFVDTDPGSDASATYDAEHYQMCAIDVVLETLFDDERWHLTEKILRPMACGKPFILVSTPGALRYLKTYGFKTFDSVWDESYDHVTDPQQRIHSIITLMSWISNLPSSRKQDIYQSAHAIAKENFLRFHSVKFQQDLQYELSTNLTEAVDHVKQYHMTGYEYLDIRRMWNHQQRDYWLNQTGISRQEQARLILKCLQNRSAGAGPRC